MPKPVKARTVRKPTSGRNSGSGANWRAESTSLHRNPVHATPTKNETFATPKASIGNRTYGEKPSQGIRRAKSAVEIRKANVANSAKGRRRTK